VFSAEVFSFDNHSLSLSLSLASMRRTGGTVDFGNYSIWKEGGCGRQK
jgi:hypothetical protein